MAISESTRLKMRTAKLGKAPWNKGLSEKTDRRIKEFWDQKRQSGLPYHSSEGLQNIRKSKLGVNNPSKRPEVREKIKAKVLQNYKDHPELRYSAGNGNRGKPSPLKGMSRPWARDRILRTMAEGKMKKVFNTKPELAMKAILDGLCIDYIFQKKINKYCLVDFYIPSRNTIIQVDGEYWHVYPFGRDKDHFQDRMLRAFGYKVLRFWANDVLKQEIVDKLLFSLFGESPAILDSRSGKLRVH